METTKLQNIIDKYNVKQTKKVIDEEFARAMRILEYEKRLNSWNEKIREWKKDINLLIANGFVFYNGLFWSNRSKPYKLKELIYACTIGTDGIWHTFGIFDTANDFDGKMPRDCGDFGIEQGGACGVWDIHTDGYTWWLETTTKMNGQTIKFIQNLRERDYKELLDKYGEDNLNKLERFEKKMQALYDYLEKAAA